jgi:hypothetical protein
MEAKVAAQNAELFAVEAAGQAIPDEQVDAIPLTAAPPTAAIDAPLVGAAQPPHDQPGAS